MFQDILVLFGDFIVIFFISRLQINLSLTKAIKNRRHREKRKEKQSFFEWLFWTRFRDVISKWKLIHYLANIIVFVLFAIAMVIVSEMLNTAIEFTLDSIFHNRYSRMVGMAKDISAGAVMFASVTSVFIGLILFGKHLFNLFLS
jgi:hypothetical protein